MHEHTKSEEQQSSKLDQPVLHPIALFFNKVKAHRSQRVSDRIYGENESNLGHAEIF